MVGLAHHFWLNLINSLTFRNKLYLKKIFRLFATINQRKFDFFSRQATAKRFSLLRSIYMVGLAHLFWLDLNKSLTF